MKMVQRMDFQNLDLVLLEGFKHEGIQKTEINRSKVGHKLMHPRELGIITIASDGEPFENLKIPLLNPNAHASIADFIEDWMKKS